MVLDSVNLKDGTSDMHGSIADNILSIVCGPSHMARALL